MKYFKVTKETTAEQLKAQYRKAAMKTHPDTGGTKEAFTEMKNEFELAAKSIGGAKSLSELSTWAEFEVEFERQYGDIDAMLNELEREQKIKIGTNRVIKAGVFIIDSVLKKMNTKMEDKNGR
jgi:hypothetical protein